MTFEEIRRLLTAHFSQLLAKRKADIAKKGRLDQLDVGALEAGAAFGREAVESGYPLIGVDDNELIAHFSEKYGLSLTPGTPAYATFTTELKRAYRDYCSSVLDYDRSLDGYEFANKTDAANDAPALAVAGPRVSLRELADRFTKDSNLGEQWGAKTQHEKADHLSLLVEILGVNADVTAISTTDAQRVKDTLIRYPRNRKKNPRTRELSLSDALNVKGVEVINVQTVNKYLRTYSSLFGWAKRNGYVGANAFEGTGVRLGRKKRSQTERRAFTQTQIQTILRALLQYPDGIVRLPYQKWGPLIALYSGARLNEIAQIHLADIRQQDGIWCFDLNDDGEDKKLKTDASRRLVPIHSRLIKLGLLEHVESLRANGEKKLFNDFTYSAKNGWGRNLGRWFNDQFLVKAGLKAKGVSFHVFRHTVVTTLGRAGVETPLIQSIVGHERQGVTHQHYFTSGYTLAQLHGAIEKLRFTDKLAGERDDVEAA